MVVSLKSSFKADFHSVEFFDWTGNPLFACENVAVNLNRLLRMGNISLCKIQSARKIPLSGNQPLGPKTRQMLASDLCGNENSLLDSGPYDFRVIEI